MAQTKYPKGIEFRLPLVTIRVTHEERESLHERASKEGVPLQVMIRRILGLQDCAVAGGTTRKPLTREQRLDAAQRASRI